MDKALYNAVEANIDWPRNQEEYPNEVVETAATALRKQIGGVQVSMEDLPSFPTLWWEDSVWKK